MGDALSGDELILVPKEGLHDGPEVLEGIAGLEASAQLEHWLALGARHAVCDSFSALRSQFDVPPAQSKKWGPHPPTPCAGYARG